MVQAHQSTGTQKDPYDLIIIGGGINGAGVARDAALRGMSVALFEKRDFGVGATANSSGMIHGGLRYLLADPGVTKLACIDSGYIQKICSHLIFRIPFVLPVMSGKINKLFLELVEVYFSAYDRYQPKKRGKSHCRLSKKELQHIIPGISPRVMGAVTTDEWGIDAARLNFINALDAAEAGAEVNTYHELDRFLQDGTRILGVRVRDRLGGGTREVYGRIVLNATGAWANHVAALAGIDDPIVRPGKGIHLVYSGRLTNYALVSEAIDGREIFIAPNQNETWIGTTDDDYWGDLDDVAVLEDEVRYMQNGIARVLPDIHKYRIVRTMVGCRPTIYKYGRMESKLSRDHLLKDHARDGASGLHTIAGGKLASYRAMSEEFTDVFAGIIKNTTACSTHTAYLPGGEPHDLTVDAFMELGLDPIAAHRILYRHGSRSRRIFDMMRRRPKTRAIICTCEPVTEAELRVVLRHELSRTLEDTRRRCRLGMGACGGAECSFKAAQIFCEERGLGAKDVPDVARTLADHAYRDRAAVLFGPQLAQEEITQGWWFLNGAMGAANTRPLIRAAEDTRDVAAPSQTSGDNGAPADGQGVVAQGSAPKAAGNTTSPAKEA